MPLIKLFLIILPFNLVLGSILSSTEGKIVQMNGELLKLNKMLANFEWELTMRPSPNISIIKREFSKLRIKWRDNWCCEFRKISIMNQLTQIEGIRLNKIMDILCSGARYSDEQSSLLSSLSDELLATYQSTEICDNSNKCFHAEPDLKRLMATTKEEKTLKWAWTSWTNAMSSVKPIYIKLIELENMGARENGYENIGEIWKEEIGIKDTEMVMNSLWTKIKDFYLSLHSVVRFKLKEVYPEIIDQYGPIPVHLLGDLWGQNWSSLLNIVLGDSSKTLNITKSMERKNYSVLDMVKRSEDYYVSLGFPRLSKKFWQNSVFTNRGNNKKNCHGSAANMYEIGDYRMMGCFQVNEGDLRVIFHELGHIYYYMAYGDEQAIFQNGVNTVFHESIGESILLGAMIPQNLQRLGFIDDVMLNDNVRSLINEALIKIPQIAYGLVVEKWRLRLFQGEIPPNKFNYNWWKLYEEIMGVVPPDSSRPDLFYFDPVAKFHIIANIPYLRYFFAGFLQFQIFNAMCQVSITGRLDENFDFPLHKCDIYGSKESTKHLRSVMEMGSSLNFSEALRKITKDENLCAEPLMKYFEPVYDFLKREIRLHSIPVGWS